MNYKSPDNSLWIAAIISLLFTLFVFWISDLSVSLSSEKMLFKQFEKIKKEISINKSNEEYPLDSVILVDTHYNQTFVEEWDDSLKYVNGLVPVTDHKLLYKLLTKLHDKDDYRYIMLDISLDKHIKQQEDSSLYKLISSMPRIVIGESNNEVADKCLVSKAGSVGYDITLWETDFTKYIYRNNEKESMALKMYKEINKDIGQMQKQSFIDKIGKKNSVFLTLDYYIPKAEYKDFTIRLEDIDEIIDDSKHKYILIGDFEDDLHSTYLGAQPGIMINYNAYLMLQKGHHKISISMFFLIFISFYILVYLTIVQTKYTWLFMWIGYPVYLILICFFVFLLYNQVYDILVSTTLFYSLKSVVEINRERILIKKRIAMLAHTVKCICQGCYSKFKKIICFSTKTIISIYQTLTVLIIKIWQRLKKTN